MELNKIYNEDCLIGMKKIPDNSVDLVLTDPPYEFTPHGGGLSSISHRATEKCTEIDFIANDFDRDAVFTECLRVLKTPNLIVFCSNKQLGKTLVWFESKRLSTDILIWQKQNPIPACNGKYVSDIEYIVYAHGKGAIFNNECPFDYKKKVFTSSLVPSQGKLHPTQKGVEHLQRYIKLHSKPNNTILDPFMGSGTTAIACIREKRNFIGFELNKEYYDKACKRIKAEQAQPTLF